MIPDSELQRLNATTRRKVLEAYRQAATLLVSGVQQPDTLDARMRGLPSVRTWQWTPGRNKVIGDLPRWEISTATRRGWSWGKGRGLKYVPVQIWMGTLRDVELWYRGELSRLLREHRTDEPVIKIY